MSHIGELISLLVAVLWTVTALNADKASHRLGSMSANVLRLVLAERSNAEIAQALNVQIPADYAPIG